jgi:diguanylate cyclase (GGDEF)-like protein
MRLTRRQIELLNDFVNQAPHSKDGVDAARFRASHEDDWENLEDLERRHFLERNEKNAYLVRIPSLVAVRDHNKRAEKSLFLAEVLFDYLRSAYKTDPGQPIFLTDLAEAIDLPIELVRRGVFYLATASIWASRSTDMNDAEAHITSSEGILRYKTFASLLAELQKWTDPQSGNPATREKQQKFGILSAPTLLTSDLMRPSGVFGMALVYMDLDNFKRINTDLTESVVDEVVLPPLHRLLEAHAEHIGIAYAEGGDEFVVLLPNFSRHMAIAFAEGLRRNIVDLRFKGAAAAVHLSVSLGIAHVAPGEDATSLKKRANEAKKFAKEQGKNVVAAWSAGGPELAIPYKLRRDDR